VTVIVRGVHLAAIRERGLQLIDSAGAEIGCVDVHATSDIRKAGRHGLVLLTVKAHQLQAIAADVKALVRDDSVIVPMQNGIPWWYFQRHGGPQEGRVVESVDPGGTLARTIDPESILGCVVYPATTMVRPGTIQHIEGNRFPLGELDGIETPRAIRISKLFVDAGLKSPILPDIRSEIWLKLWGNLSFNPISALAHATLVDLCKHPLARELARNMMLEAEAVANKLGRQLRVTVDRRIEGAERVGKHKTSMLQDVECGRDPEIDALVGAVIELGRVTNTPTPHINAVYACVKLLSQTMSSEKVAVRMAPLASAA
jgi:2-dehydropantoate 2-reductase